MIYVDFSAGNKDYKLRLNTRSVVALEKQLGCNPLAIFGNGDTIPTITVMVAILHASLQQFNHGITLNDAYDIFDAWLDEGHSTVDFVNVILEIYKTSGIVPNEVETAEEASEVEKN
jgi:hypothetical protein